MRLYSLILHSCGKEGSLQRCSKHSTALWRYEGHTGNRWKWIQQLSASHASKLYRFKDSARKKLWTICMYSAVHDLSKSSNCYIVMISLILKFQKLKDIDSQTPTMAGDSWRLAIAAWVMAMWNRSHWRMSSPNIWFMVIPAPSTQAEQKVISFIQATETATSLLRLTSCHRNGDVMPLFFLFWNRQRSTAYGSRIYWKCTNISLIMHWGVHLCVWFACGLCIARPHLACWMYSSARCYCNSPSRKGKRQALISYLSNRTNTTTCTFTLFVFNFSLFGKNQYAPSPPKMFILIDTIYRLEIIKDVGMNAEWKETLATSAICHGSNSLSLFILLQHPS